MSSRVNIRKLSSFIPRNDPDMRRAVRRILDIDCKSGKVDISDAHFCFDQMRHMRYSISCFVTLLAALVKSGHSPLVVLFYKTLDVSGVLGPRSHLTVLNVLLNCYSRMGLGSAVTFNSLKNGHRPNAVTFYSLLKGLCLEGKMVEALGLFSKMYGKMVEALGLLNIWNYAKMGQQEEHEVDNPDLVPGLLFQHAGHRDKVVDFHWNSYDPWTIVSVSDDCDTSGGGGTLQIWRMTDLLYRMGYFCSTLIP